MGKLFLFFISASAFLLADDGSFTGQDLIKAFSIAGAVIGLGAAAGGGASGMGSASAATILGTARNPSMGPKLMTTMFISLAMIEAQVIYALVVGLIALYANPFLG